MTMSNGKIVQRKRKFTQVSNYALSDRRLSLRAIGLYSKINYYLTRPNWDLYKNFIMNECKEGADAFNTVWNELKENGYLIQHKIRGSDGKYCYEYELLDKITTPCFSTPSSITPSSITPSSITPSSITPENPPPIHNTITNNTITNNTITNNTNTHHNNLEILAENENFCDDVRNLKKELDLLLGIPIWEQELQKLVNNKGIDIIRKYISIWEQYRPYAKSTQAAYFIYTVTNEIPPPQQQQQNNIKVPQRECFNQRDYTDDELEKYYVDVTKI